ncbi:RNA polymerase sigma factor sigF, chloroplastic-like [Impatiens glandulifera]|uniref:RNA polymerase sigma factor sigF, chloroplastic-like n=1 Tax=Impatiens glandulifera TaxID=253017 RepID=UPI001FB0506C|nr:RNA polymerase sigma factor sigF, chloroplastic-like [Impatiens glandulifera]
MESGMNLLASSPPFPSRTHFVKNCTSSSSSVLMLPHDQTMPTFSGGSSSSSSGHLPTSVLLQDQHDENRACFQALERGQKNYRSLEDEDHENIDTDQFVKDFQRQLLNMSLFWHLLPFPSDSQSVVHSKIKQDLDLEPHSVVALAKKALSASKQAAFLCEDLQSYETAIDASSDPSLPEFLHGEKVVRSTRLIERRSKKRNGSKYNVTVGENSNSLNENSRKTRASFDLNDPVRMFLWGPETKQLLTRKEEDDFFDQIQNLMKLEEVKTRLHTEFGREPTLVEWAEATGLTSRELKSRLNFCNRSRERLISANLRMVVHIAKQYQNHGLKLHDLLQEGSMGLLKSVEKFKPQAGCRFATYAYWWIRQSIRKAIFQHSRMIRLPDNVYGLLNKVKEAKRFLVQEGNRQPTKPEIAERSGIKIEKLESLLYSTRTPLSMQQPIWTDQDTIFQEVTADMAIENPELVVAKQLMRKHVHYLLGSLSARERGIMQMRFGIGGSRKPKSLSEIGDYLGLSKERVRQIEYRAFKKLKQNGSSQGLDAYANLVI